MSQTSPPTSPRRTYDLEARCLAFAKRVRDYINRLPKTITNIEYGKQLARSSGSTGANYIEANEAISRKDFIMRIRISKKESKESIHWLELTVPYPQDEREKQDLIRESTELMKIFGSILENSKPS